MPISGNLRKITVSGTWASSTGRETQFIKATPLNVSILSEKDLYVNGRKAKTIELLEKIRVTHGIGFVALRRKDDSGTIVINLDKEGLKYWSMKVAVERGISKMGEGHGMVYLQIFNDQNKMLGKIGQLPKELIDLPANQQEILKSTKKIISQKVQAQGNNILDVTAPFILDKKVAGIVRIGLERGSMDKIIAENQRNIFIFMLLVVVIASPVHVASLS